MGVEIRIDYENNPSGIFYAGTMLRGTVRMTLTDEKTVRGVYIRIYGKGYCKWSRGSGKSRVTYVGEEIYLDETTYLAGSAAGNITLTPGVHTYNIQCNLPARLPTSVEGNIGYIRYTARVIMDVPMGFDKELKQRFTVIRPMNLNNNRMLRQPVVSTLSDMDCCSSLCCCFCICLNPIEVTTEIPVAGYTPGQIINLQVHVTNKGSPKDYEFYVALMKRIDYCAENQNVLNCCDSGSHYNDETECVGRQSASCRISNTTSVETVRLNVEVPPVPPTDCDSSNVVTVTYFLKVTTSAGFCNGSPENSMPITIGTYPIEDVVAPNANATAPITDQPTAPLLDSELPGYSPNKELPTYEEAMDMADGGFRPKYPVFKRTTSYSSKN